MIVSMRVTGLFGLTCLGVSALTAAPVYHKDVQPILERRCQGCHRPGDIGPMSLMTYEEARPWAKAIRAAILKKKMPPWFAEAGHGKYLNDPSLSQTEIDTLVAWTDAGAPEGDRKNARKPVEFVDGWRIGKPDAVVELSKPFQIPASGEVPYQYISVPSGFTEDKWVTAIEVRPTNRKVVHHIIASANLPPAGSNSARPAGEFFTSDAEKQLLKTGRELPQFAAQGSSDLLQVYVPGGAPPAYQPGQAKLIKAGSHINFQLHYTTSGKPEQDQTGVGFIFAKEPPKERIKSILVYHRNFAIPPTASNHPVSARAEVLRDVRLVSMLPHMHLRGKDFEFRATYPSGQTETLLRVAKYDFNWQINYYLAEPKLLPKGTILECFGHYDNSANNPHNPDPSAEVRYGEQTWEEMLNGFMEVAMEPTAANPEILGKAPDTSSKRAP
jgi:hypothetical protein